MRKPKFVVADTMDLWIGMARADLVELIKEVDMLILNDSEARQLTEEDNLIRAGRKIAAMGPRYVAVKKGEHGCLLFGRKGEFFSTGAFPLEAIKDPTGAGDCFAGGVIGHLARTDDTRSRTSRRRSSRARWWPRSAWRNSACAAWKSWRPARSRRGARRLAPTSPRSYFRP